LYSDGVKRFISLFIHSFIHSSIHSLIYPSIHPFSGLSWVVLDELRLFPLKTILQYVRVQALKIVYARTLFVEEYVLIFYISTHECA